LPYDKNCSRRVLWGIFNGKGQKVRGGWRKLHNEVEVICKKVKQSLYTPWRRLGGEEV
jgi:hypothetical protein